MPFAMVGDTRIYYEFTGPEDGPTILQFGGSLLGRQNFSMVNDAFRERGFRLLSYDYSGYGRSDAPVEYYTVEGWADEAAGLLDALGIDRVLTHGTSMGGMVSLAFTCKYPDKVIASCADCGIVRCDTYRRTLFRSWRKMVECSPLDDFCDMLTIQAVSADYIDAHPEIFDGVRYMVSKNAPYTVRQACIAMETMDLEPLIPSLRRPILFTNGTHDLMTPPRLSPSGYGVAKVAEGNPEWARLIEFPDIGHAPLLEIPDQAVATVTGFFDEILEREGLRAPAGTASV